MSRRLVLAIASLAVAACALPASSCGVGPGEQEAGEGTLTVTRNFGEEPLGSRATGGASESDTVMRVLQRDFEVETRFGGNFVEEIDGVAGGGQDGRRVDWFYYVNGILAEDGAAAHKLGAGDDVWWDHHDWSASADVRAVVGAFPEPFLSGVGGKRLPVRLDCAAAAQDACDEVAERLGRVGVKAGRSAAGGFGGEGLLRIKVGFWADLRRDATVRRLEEGPRASGVYARPSAVGDAIALLDPEGRTVRTLDAGSGLVAATKLGGEAPTWVVTGTDAVGLAAAAAQLDRDALADRFAIALEDGRPVALPIQPPPETP